MRVGFIGLGTMGGKMAASLQGASLSLVVHDARRETAAAHLGLGALVAQYRPEQHIERALGNGVTKTEISEIITHMAFYSGWPTAMTAAFVAKEVFEKQQ